MTTDGGEIGSVSPLITVALEPEFDFLSMSYRTLFAASCATAFQHPVWLDTFYNTLAVFFGAEKLVVTGRNEATGALVFVLPLLRRRRARTTVIEATYLGVGDYAHPIVAPELRGRDFRRAVRKILPRHDVLNIRPIREEALQLWSAFLPGNQRTLAHSSHAAILSASYAEWRAKALAPRFAKDLDRKKRRFFKSGRVEIVQVNSDFRGAIDLIANIRSGRFRNDILQNPIARKFYADVAKEGRGFARIHRLLLDGEDVAQAYGIVLGARFNYVLISADYERFGRHSPGIVMYDLLIEECIKEGGTIFDFTIGDEPFKRDFGTTETPMYALVKTPTLKGRAAISTFDAVGSVLTRMGQARWWPVTA